MLFSLITSNQTYVHCASSAHTMIWLAQELQVQLKIQSRIAISRAAFAVASMMSLWKCKFHTYDILFRLPMTDWHGSMHQLLINSKVDTYSLVKRTFLFYFVIFDLIKICRLIYWKYFDNAQKVTTLHRSKKVFLFFILSKNQWWKTCFDLFLMTFTVSSSC